MQKRLSATGLVTSLLVIGAGTLLTAQVHQLPGAEGWNIPGWILWAGEASTFLAALLLWTQEPSGLSVALGLAALFSLRLAVGAAAAAVYQLVHPAGEFSAVLGACYTSLPSRVCSIVFALMAFYPARTLLPRRAAVVRVTQRASKEAPFQNLLHSPASKSANFLFAASGPGAGEASATAGGTLTRSGAEMLAGMLPADLQEHKILIPLQLLACQLPSGVLKQEVMERLPRERLEVAVPLNVIFPQLKEALVQISVALLLSFFPKGWVLPPAAGGEEKITLPLEAVIPQVPEEALQLPAPSPPAWAGVLQEEEKLLFARV